MGYTMGCPLKKLNNLPSGGGRKGAANAKAFMLEPFKERNCKDEDYNPNRTIENIYWGADGKECDPIAGMEILQNWNTNAQNYKGLTRSGKATRGVRKDAVIGGAGIIKPSLEFMDSLGSEDEQVLFLKRVTNYLYEEFAPKNEIKMDAVVLQLDEANLHLHYAFHDDDMHLGKKIGLKMFQMLNVDLPNYMRDTYGYDIDPCRRFDPDVAAQMTDEELIEYKAQIQKDKAQAGKDARKYKADREIKKAKDEAEKIIEDAQTLADSIEAKVNAYENLPEDPEVLINNATASIRACATTNSRVIEKKRYKDGSFEYQVPTSNDFNNLYLMKRQLKEQLDEINEEIDAEKRELEELSKDFKDGYTIWKTLKYEDKLERGLNKADWYEARAKYEKQGLKLTDTVEVNTGGRTVKMTVKEACNREANNKRYKRFKEEIEARKKVLAQREQHRTGILGMYNTIRTLIDKIDPKLQNLDIIIKTAERQEKVKESMKNLVNQAYEVRNQEFVAPDAGIEA